MSSLSGVILSVLYEMPPGPAIAVTATLFYLLAAFLSPEKGLLGKWLRRKQQAQKIIKEDVLKAAYKISFNQKTEIASLRKALSISPAKLNTCLRRLQQQQLLRKENDGTYILTESGRDQANKLIRAHRLWESYLVQEMGMDADQIHDEAERYEHLLTSEQVDAVDKQLGFPALDPHGSPIPSKEKAPVLSLVQLELKDHAIISLRQPGVDIMYRLWSLGLGPGDSFEVKRHDKDFVIQVKEKDILVPEDLAGKVSVEKV
jgi:Mn-dependent DtxR family transcriptional regulator